jgi:hypothetical protein
MRAGLPAKPTSSVCSCLAQQASAHHTLQVLCVQPVWEVDAALFALMQVDCHPQRHAHRKTGLERAVVALHRMRKAC